MHLALALASIVRRNNSRPARYAHRRSRHKQTSSGDATCFNSTDLCACEKHTLKVVIWGIPVFIVGHFRFSPPTTANAEEATCLRGRICRLHSQPQGVTQTVQKFPLRSRCHACGHLPSRPQSVKRAPSVFTFRGRPFFPLKTPSTPSHNTSTPPANQSVGC